MRILLQRISEGWVEIEGDPTDKAGPGLLALVGFAAQDGTAVLAPMVKKLIELRIFQDGQGKMNRSLLETGGALVLVSQFTLYADCRKGRRPGFSGAMAGEEARRLFETFVAQCRAWVPRVITGKFAAQMRVHLVNEGPVTIWLDSADFGITSALQQLAP